MKKGIYVALNEEGGDFIDEVSSVFENDLHLKGDVRQ